MLHASIFIYFRLTFHSHWLLLLFLFLSRYLLLLGHNLDEGFVGNELCQALLFHWSLAEWTLSVAHINLKKFENALFAKRVSTSLHYHWQSQFLVKLQLTVITDQQVHLLLIDLLLWSGSFYLSLSYNACLYS